jgi:malate dehydrogenase (oxaloacetate-decarboxylating)
MDIFKDSINFHKKNRGKLSVQSKTPIKNRRTLSLVYTPGVGGVSQEIAKDTSKNKKSLRELTIKQNTVAVISDGSSVLGFGNIGPEAALPVMEGKAALFKEFAGIDAFPICLKTQDPDEIVRTVKNISVTFGAVNLEDIAAPLCFDIEKQLRAELDIPVMHDDQHGTATVVLAGLINALKLRKLKPAHVRLVINGGGAAGTAIANILIAFGIGEIVVCDSKGAIFTGRGDLNSEKKMLAGLTNRNLRKGSLADVVAGAHVFVGVSRAGLLTAEMVKSMAPSPIVFALANPVPEIMPNVARDAGAFVVATGRSDFPNQVNNVLAFPGIFRGALDNRISQFTDEMFVRAAKNLAAVIKKPTREKILPDVFDRNVVKAVARAIK